MQKKSIPPIRKMLNKPPLKSQSLPKQIHFQQNHGTHKKQEVSFTNKTKILKPAKTTLNSSPQSRTNLKPIITQKHLIIHKAPN